MTALLEHGRRVHGTSTVATFDGTGVRRATFAEVATRAERLAAALRRLGIRESDRVGTFCWNTQEHMEAYLAVPSMGAVLLTAGTKGKRSALPNSRIMIHQPLGGTSGQAADVEIYAKEILGTRDRLNKILAQHTGRSLKEIERDTDRNYFLSADEAKEYGLVDEVIDKRP